MNVLLTGAYGCCGTAITDYLLDRDEADSPGRDEYEFTLLDRSGSPDDWPGERTADRVTGRPDDPPDDAAESVVTEPTVAETVVADVADYDAIRPVFDGRDAVVHLAANPSVEAGWSDLFEPNVVGAYNVFAAARDAGVETVVFASSNHVVGMYEVEHAPDLYTPEYGLVIDHTDPVRPDSLYGVSKSFGEDLGRYFVENHAFPTRFFALRIGSVRWPAYDHPYGDAERGVEEGEWARGSDEYEQAVARLKATWHSRRDFAHEVECCLRAEREGFDVFYGVSDNRRRWFDLEHARATIGYDPQDDAEAWNGPPDVVGQT